MLAVSWVTSWDCRPGGRITEGGKDLRQRRADELRRDLIESLQNLIGNIAAGDRVEDAADHAGYCQLGECGDDQEEIWQSCLVSVMGEIFDGSSDRARTGIALAGLRGRLVWKWMLAWSSFRGGENRLEIENSSGLLNVRHSGLSVRSIR